MGRYAVGLDVGGTKTLAVLVDENDSVLATKRLRTDTSVTDGILATMHQAIDGLLADHGIGPGDLASIGVGIPGRVDHRRGEVTFAVNLGIRDLALPVAASLAKSYGAEVRVENDVNAAALGAFYLLGAGRPEAAGGVTSVESEHDGATRTAPVTDIAYLSLGTGVAAGLVLGGVLHRGSNGVAGEIGHLPLDPGGALCECGLRGCLEASASGSAIARRWPGDGMTAPAQHLFATAAAGDARAIAIRDAVLDDIARAVVMLMLTIDPDRVVLGGGVVEVGATLLEGLRGSLSRMCRRSPFLASLDIERRTVAVPSDLPTGAVGAARIARGGS